MPRNLHTTLSEKIRAKTSLTRVHA